jgi:hypothetical protein
VDERRRRHLGASLAALIARRTRKRHRSFIQAADAKAARFFPDPRAPEGRINLGAFACGDTITLNVRFGSKADMTR